MKKTKIVIFSGPPGSGKTTEMLKQIKHANFEKRLLVSVQSHEKVDDFKNVAFEDDIVTFNQLAR